MSRTDDSIHDLKQAILEMASTAIEIHDSAEGKDEFNLALVEARDKNVVGKFTYPAYLLLISYWDEVLDWIEDGKCTDVDPT